MRPRFDSLSGQLIFFIFTFSFALDVVDYFWTIWRVGKAKACRRAEKGGGIVSREERMLMILIGEHLQLIGKVEN
jgi:hypothetical protein